MNKNTIGNKIKMLIGYELYDIMWAMISDAKTAVIALEEDIPNEIKFQILKRFPGLLHKLNELPLELQLRMVEDNPSAIRVIKNQTEELQLIAIKRNVELFMHLRNPTKKIQILAAKTIPSTYAKYITDDEAFKVFCQRLVAEKVMKS